MKNFLFKHSWKKWHKKRNKYVRLTHDFFFGWRQIILWLSRKKKLSTLRMFKILVWSTLFNKKTTSMNKYNNFYQCLTVFLSVCLQLCKILKIIMIISSQTMTKRKMLWHKTCPYSETMSCWFFVLSARESSPAKVLCKIVYTF